MSKSCCMIVSLAVASVAVVQATAVMAVTKAVTKKGGNLNKDENLNKKKNAGLVDDEQKNKQKGWQQTQKGMSKLSKIDKIREILCKWCIIHLQRIANGGEAVQAGVAAAKMGSLIQARIAGSTKLIKYIIHLVNNQPTYHIRYSILYILYD